MNLVLPGTIFKGCVRNIRESWRTQGQGYQLPSNSIDKIITITNLSWQIFEAEFF